MIAKIKLNNEKILIRQATKLGYIECVIGGIADFSYPSSTLRRGRVQGGGMICPALTTSSNLYIFEGVYLNE